MTNKNSIFAAVGLLLVILIGVGIWLFSSKEEPVMNNDSYIQATSVEAALDIALDYYDAWFTAAKSTTTNPYEASLATFPLLSKELSLRLVAAQAEFSAGNDPVLCQTTMPEKIAAEAIFELDDSAQIRVFARGAVKLPGQAVVSLKRLNGGWYISDIQCGSGEAAPEREFDFENTGYLIKSVVPPLDANFWHLIFEENGEKGHYAPLIFDGESICVSIKGNESACDTSKFIEPSKVMVQGGMSESGVIVEKVSFLE